MTTDSYDEEVLRYRRSQLDKDQLRQSVSGPIEWFMDWRAPPFYDKHGELLSEGEWCERSRDPSCQWIIYTKLHGRKAVLTV
jgi:hypothetical protein